MFGHSQALAIPFASSGDTSCDNCSVVMMGTAMTSSRASSQTSGELLMLMQRPPQLLCSTVACEYDL
jgi:hypothetical protein